MSPVSRLGLVTPYPAPTTRRLAAYLAEHGIRVVATVPLNRLAPVPPGGPAGTAQQLRAQAWNGAEAIFFCSTNVATYDLIEPLAAALAAPVLTANEVLMHAALRALGRPESLVTRPPGGCADPPTCP